MIRRATEMVVSGNVGLFIDEGTHQTLLDMKVLTEKGLYAYGVRHNDSGTFSTLEPGACVVNHAGYAVFKKPVKFPVRPMNPCDKYFCLNNQHSYIDNRWSDVDVLSWGECNE